MPKGAKPNEKQRRFVEYYTGVSQGSATDAARRAGYAHPDRQGPRLLRNVVIAECLAQASAEVRSTAIATREERQEFLTAMMRGEEPGEPKDRIKATEILGKMQGDFIERHHVTTDGPLVSVYVPDNGRG
jgi:phage terminase small subunit